MKKAIYLVVAAVIGVVFLAACKPEPTEPPTDGGGTTGPTPYDYDLPSNLPPISEPSDNEASEEGVALGRFLFYDERLSDDNTMSCASCHVQSFSFTDEGNTFSEGITGIAGDRNSMAIINLVYGTSFFWDGRAPSLEAQALQPVTNIIELHETWPDVAVKLAADPAYPPMFEAAFGTTHVDSTLVTKAIGQFMRSARARSR